MLVDRVLRFDSEAVGTGVTLFATIATTGATMALAWFGWVQMQGERRKRESEQRVADAHLSTTAVELRKPLADWILASQDQTWSVNLAQEGNQHAANLLPRLARALADAAVASPDVEAHLRTAYAYCQQASRKFEAYLTQYHQSTQAQLRGVDREAYAALNADTALLSDGRESLRGCCHELERIVDPSLLADVKRLGAWREV